MKSNNLLHLYDVPIQKHRNDQALTKVHGCNKYTPRIVIIEGNRDILDFFIHNFRSCYSVIMARNEVQALEIIRENEVDLVVGHVITPEKDGRDLCRILKGNIATHHIGILMISGCYSTDSQIECYNAGVDAYITYPIDFRVLKALVENLIEKRNLSNSIRKYINTDFSQKIRQMNNVFIMRAIEVVELKLSDSTFNIDEFALLMFVSKSTLYRGLKNLINMSPVEFIRNMRLSQASRLLIANSLNIAEIAFAVGFQDPKYFSFSFRLLYGMTPRDFRNSYMHYATK